MIPMLAIAAIVTTVAPSPSAPQFAHDCDCCTFLGRHDGADLYRCGDSVVARFSEASADNTSTSVEALRQTGAGNRWAQEAMRRALAAGIV